MRGLGDSVECLEGGGLGVFFVNFLIFGDPKAGVKSGSGGGGGSPVSGGGGGLKLPFKDELWCINRSGDGGGGNSGDADRGAKKVSLGELGNGGGGGGDEGADVEFGGRGGGKGGGGPRGVFGVEEVRWRGLGGGRGGPELFSESEVLEDKEVEDEETEPEERSEDFLSGTLGLGRLPEEGDMDLTKAGTGVPAVGVLDWLE